MADNEALNALAARVQSAKDLRDELAQARKGGVSKKDLERFLRDKDRIVGTGQHHAIRNVSAGQIIGDLQKFIDEFDNGG